MNGFLATLALFIVAAVVLAACSRGEAGTPELPPSQEQRQPAAAPSTEAPPYAGPQTSWGWPLGARARVTETMFDEDLDLTRSFLLRVEPHEDGNLAIRFSDFELVTWLQEPVTGPIEDPAVEAALLSGMPDLIVSPSGTLIRIEALDRAVDAQIRYVRQTQAPPDEVIASMRESLTGRRAVGRLEHGAEVRWRRWAGHWVAFPAVAGARSEEAGEAPRGQPQIVVREHLGVAADPVGGVHLRHRTEIPPSQDGRSVGVASSTGGGAGVDALRRQLGVGWTRVRTAEATLDPKTLAPVSVTAERATHRADGQIDVLEVYEARFDWLN